jgi:hypothetical protein
MKRNKTKRRRKTRDRRIKKRNKTNRKNIKGGDNKKKIKYNCNGSICVPSTSGEYDTYIDCFMNCSPLPPPPPVPPSINSLKSITSYSNIKSRKLYILTKGDYPNGTNILLFIPSYTPSRKRMKMELMMIRDLIKRDTVDWGAPAPLLETPTKKMLACFLRYIENLIENSNDELHDCYRCLYYNMIIGTGTESSFNELCINKSNMWVAKSRESGPSFTEYLFSKVDFDYLSTIYKIYEFDEWPEEIPRIPNNLDPERDFIHIPFGAPLRLENSESPLQPSTHYG